ncbi:MAG: class I SAM-dependent methyltransferase [Dehalococcoidales bacterium]|nr:class I SAM-dependent methyltransferase [Dehalococcoidales bacterium]
MSHIHCHIIPYQVRDRRTEWKFGALCYNRVNMDIYSDYDPFAWMYNRHWGNSFLPTLMPILENLVLSKLPREGRILDLCCGTGQLARQLDILGYKVTGIDGSGEMLNYARQNAPAVKFLQADARSFRLPSKYHAVVSVFDSLNHIMTLKELKMVFSRVRDALRDDGIFMFDLNTEAGYLHEWDGDFTIAEDDHVCLVRNIYDSTKRIATFDATSFRLHDDNWCRTDVILSQKCHAPASVKSALKSAGFSDIEAYGFNWESGMRILDANARRAFFLCRKTE